MTMKPFIGLIMILIIIEESQCQNIFDILNTGFESPAPQSWPVAGPMHGFQRPRQRPRPSPFGATEEQLAEVLSESAKTDPKRQQLDALIKRTGGKLTGDAAPLNYIIEDYFLNTVPPEPALTASPSAKQNNRNNIKNNAGNKNMNGNNKQMANGNMMPQTGSHSKPLSHGQQQQGSNGAPTGRHGQNNAWQDSNQNGHWGPPGQQPQQQWPSQHTQPPANPRRFLQHQQKQIQTHTQGGQHIIGGPAPQGKQGGSRVKVRNAKPGQSIAMERMQAIQKRIDSLQKKQTHGGPNMNNARREGLRNEMNALNKLQQKLAGGSGQRSRRPRPVPTQTQQQYPPQPNVPSQGINNKNMNTADPMFNDPVLMDMFKRFMNKMGYPPKQGAVPQQNFNNNQNTNVGHKPRSRRPAPRSRNPKQRGQAPTGPIKTASGVEIAPPIKGPTSKPPMEGDVRVIGGVKYVYADVDGFDVFQWKKAPLTTVDPAAASPPATTSPSAK